MKLKLYNSPGHYIYCHMSKYKSVKTHERISKIQTPIPSYEYDTYEEIDEKFNTLMHNRGRRESETGGSSLASIFGAVVVQTAIAGVTMSNLESQNQPQPNRLAQSILKAFDINPHLLNSMKSKQEKHQYLMQRMNETINSLLKNWSDKLFLKEQKYKELDDAQRKEKISSRSKKHFKWLQLKTKYEQLKNKLRQIVVDKLNDYENSQELLNAQRKQIMLKNVAIINTRDIFENMEKYGHSNEFHFLKSLGQERLNKIRQQQSLDLKNSTVDHGKSPSANYQVDWNNFEEKRFKDQRNKTRQLFTNEVSSSNWNDLGFLPILQQMALQEKKKQQRDHIMNRYIEGELLTAQELQFLVNTSDLLNACLDKDFFQRAANNINSDLLANMELALAEQIMKDYEEMKQATMRARLSFIRKKIERTKKKLEQREIQQQKLAREQFNLEQNRRYIKICTTVVHHMERTGKFQEKYPADLPGAEILNDYLNGKIDERTVIVRLRDIAYEKEKRRRNRYELGSQFDLYQTRAERASQSENKSMSEDKLQMKEAEKKRKATYYKEMSRPKSTIGMQFITNIKRHIYHPSTKVLINKKLDADEMEMAYINPIRMQYNKYEQEKFKLGLKSHPALRQRDNFKKFYSGGPPNQGEETRTIKNEPTQREIRAAIVIQRKLRALFRERRLRQKLEERRKQIYYLFKDNCETMMQQVEMDRQDMQVQNFIITKQLEKCKTVAKDNINFGRLRTEENLKLKTKPKTQMSLYSTDVSTPKNPSLQQIKFPNQHNRVKVEHLFEAVKKNRFMMIRQSHFVYAAGDLNCQTIEGETPLHIAVKNSNQDFVEWLLQNGADPYMMNVNGVCPHDLAVQKNKTNILRLFKMYCPI